MMLCDKIEKKELPLFVSAINKDDFIAEEKMDGDRIKMTVKEMAVTLTNRRENIVTDKYPEFQGKQYLPNCVLDGEMCVIKHDLSQFLEGISFRTHNKAREVIEQMAKKYPATFVVFDILELDGINLMDYSLRERKKMLAQLNISHPNIKIIKPSKDILALWKEVTDKDGEGIIIKDLNSKYYYGKRKIYWRKVKAIKEEDLEFDSYTTNPKGIVLSNKAGIRVACNGSQAEEVISELKKKGKVLITIRFLRKTKEGKYFQPTYLKINL